MVFLGPGYTVGTSYLCTLQLCNLMHSDCVCRDTQLHYYVRMFLGRAAPSTSATNLLAPLANLVSVVAKVCAAYFIVELHSAPSNCAI